MKEEPKKFIIGHKNPDTDSIASAVAYAEFKKLSTNDKNYIPASAGIANKRTEALFKKFNTSLPKVIKNIAPRVMDVLSRSLVTVESCNILLEVMNKLQRSHLYRLPVTNRNGIYKGMISLFDLTSRFFRNYDTDSTNDSDSLLSRKINTSINLASRALKAEKLSLFEERKFEELVVYVAAMSLTEFREHVAAHDPKQLVIVVGDREDIQFMAIELKIRLLIVTGNAYVSKTIIDLARRNGISILRTNLDSASSVRRLKFSTPAAQIMQNSTLTFRGGDRLSDIKHLVFKSQDDIFPVINSKNELKGIIKKGNLAITSSIQLILVDHNNYDQAVDGASELPLLEILDHHHLDMPITTKPVTVLNDTVGSTCTLVSEKFKLAGLSPSKSIAGILTGGILSDTLILKSPTTTERDKLAVNWLEKFSETSISEYEKEIFKAESTIANNPPDKLLKEDKKNYNASGYNISIAQVEEFSFKEFNDRSEKLLTHIKSIREEEKLDLFGLLVTNVETQNSILLADGLPRLSDILPFQRTGKNTFELPGILSRKKQLIPQLFKVVSESN
ncbi:MAG: putative manganese-dependent inorganic diphosphatase [Victivallales bacterium]|nr:putative manganese-dependent inorganic diphosphatase [Victivallales bacterium]MCF7888579.1 putative manganese-dependent inorganic diphosphatase [Victivallales bacterium]